MAKKAPTKDQFGDDNAHDMFGDAPAARGMTDFETMLNESNDAKRVSPGASLRGEILSIGKDGAFVATGTPVDGAIPLRELQDDKGVLKYKVGDIIDVKVVRVRQDEILLRLAGSTNSGGDLESLEDAFDMEIPLEGIVTEAVKGGFRVKIQGKMAFCPVSQIDSRFVTETAEYVGKKFDFIITQFDSAGRNLVVSRKKILSLKKAESEGEFLAQQKQGDILQGHIRRIEKYGAFVELESGVEGLIPISELAWGRVNDPSEIVHIGQAVSVALVRAVEDGDRLKVSLSLKQAGGEGDPWMQVTTKFPVGTVASGTIERKETYGLFVRLAPGITGLMPRNKWRDHADAKTFDNMKKGETVSVQVDEILFEEHKITLAPQGDALDVSWKSHSAGAGSAAANARGAGFGTLGDLLKGVKPTK